MAETTQDVVPKKLSQEEFQKLEIEKKAELIDNLILDSMYEQLAKNKVKLSELTKAKVNLDKYRNKQKQARISGKQLKEKRFIDSKDNDD